MKLLGPAFAVMLVVVLACSSSKSARPGGPSNTPSGECKADADCVIVETACCDHCNGGKAEAFPKSKPPAPAAGCTDIACTEMACGPMLPRCDAGKCTAVQGPL